MPNHTSELIHLLRDAGVETKVQHEVDVVLHIVHADFDVLTERFQVGSRKVVDF